MRAIHLVHLDKSRPALILTREMMHPHLSRLTVAPITSTIKGVSTEVLLDQRNGVDGQCVVSCDNIMTVPKSEVGKLVGYLLPSQESELAMAIAFAFELNLPT